MRRLIASGWLFTYSVYNCAALDWLDKSSKGAHDWCASGCAREVP
jgi:hypothetical protein